MLKIYNLPQLVKKCFLLILLVFTIVISYGQNINQEQSNENQGSSIASPNQVENINRKRRFQIMVEVGYQYQLFGENINRVKLNLGQSYYFNSYISAGVGVGVRYYYDADLFLLPLYLHFRARMLQSSLAPYFSIGIGYSSITSKGLLPMGLCLNPELGISYKINDDVELYCTMGYEMQNLLFVKTSYDYGIRSSTVNLDAFSVSAGVAF